MADDYSGKGLFSTAGHGRNFHRRRPMGAIERFAELLSEHDTETGDRGGNVATCARRMGIKPSQGNAMLQRIRRLHPQYR